MQTYFYELADFIAAQIQGDEAFTATFGGEESDFVRFSRNQVRQAGSVTQREMSLDLVDGRRHARGSVTLSGSREIDRARLKTRLEALRDMLPHLPEDPHLLHATEVHSSETHGENRLLPAPEAMGAVMSAAQGKDLVGVHASGGIFAGFANSFGQRNWYSTYSFNLDWSLYLHDDKAVKLGYGGFEWNEDEFSVKMDSASEQLATLALTPRTIDPGRYRVFLSPVALLEIMGILAWGGFGLKDHRTKQTTLLRMVEDGAQLHPGVTVVENTAEGVAPDFQGAGFIKPDRVALIEGGCFRNCLTSPRSAKEYGVPTNGASVWEMPESIDVAPGTLPRDDVLQSLNTGLYINNLHYLNYSDRPNCRITGMTRFATFWVERGRIVAPVNVMRFDETVYRMLGEHLVDLTAEREFLLDPMTYEGRSTQSARVPGAVIEDFTLTL